MEHRDLLQQELDLQHSHPERFDPATIVDQHWIAPTVFVQGSVTTDAQGAVTWHVQLVDANSGAALGGDDGSAAAGDAFTASSTIADRLLDQVCPHHYELTLDLLSTAALTPYTATGTIKSALTAAAGAPGHWAGTGSVVYGDLQFASAVPDVTFSDPVSPTGTWKADIASAGDGTVNVTWSADEILATATVHVEDLPPAPGIPGPALRNQTPLAFSLPAAGGSQPIAGGFSPAAGASWTHAGTLTVRRVDDESAGA